MSRWKLNRASWTKGLASFLALAALSACEVAVSTSSNILGSADADSLTAPTDITLSAASITENNSPGAIIASLSTKDSDPHDRFIYSLVSGSGSTDNSRFLISDSVLKLVGTADYESQSSYSIRIRSADSAGYKTEKAFTIKVLNQNEAPTDIFLSATSIAENQLAESTVGTLTTADPDALSNWSYSLVSGEGATDNASFLITGATLKMAISANAEAKSSYSIRIRTTDSGGLYFEKPFTISITDVPEAPTNLSLSASSILEGAPIGTIVGTLATVDPDSTSGFTYSLTSGSGDTDNARFTIDQNNLKIMALSNFERQSQYWIRMKVIDPTGLSIEKAFTLSVANMCSLTSTPQGIGTSSNPYRICSRSHLAQLNQSTSKYFSLLRDIDMSSEAFTPIGNFKGHFEGGGRAILNLSISAPSSSYVGFFSKLSGATVRNLILSNVNVSGAAYVGGLAGRIGPGSLVSRVSVSGSVTNLSGHWAGGLAGIAQYARITQSRSSASVTGPNWYVGGLIGECAYFCEISHSDASGPTTGRQRTGGLVASLGMASKLSYSVSMGYVQGQGSAATVPGPLVSMSYVYGGEFGSSTSTPLSAVISNSYWNADAYNAPQLGTGVSASAPGSAFDNWDPAIWSISSSDFPILRYFGSPMTTPEMAETPLTPSLCQTPTPFDGGQGTRSWPFLISNASQLRNMRCNPSASFRLTSNIDLAGVSYLPVDSYTGVFDGAGYTISNLQLNSPDQYKLGLFNQLSGAVVKDLTMQNVTLTGAYAVGAVAGLVDAGSVVLRCKSSGIINVVSSPTMSWGPGSGGGLVGQVALSIIAESSSSATVNAGHRSGGLIGQGEPMAMIWDS
ncbi:MAG: cadherin repeat domain-containing protein, partial [Bdellovibrionales bacterium]|nr:cadherin repeat domain-containing protein [Bdellovibrionales bacterium]